MDKDLAHRNILSRFYQALDDLIAKRIIRGVNTYCRLYGIDRRNLTKQREDLSRSIFDVSWMVPMVSVYNISATWLLTGKGEMYTQRSQDAGISGILFLRKKEAKNIHYTYYLNYYIYTLLYIVCYLSNFCLSKIGSIIIW